MVAKICELVRELFRINPNNRVWQLPFFAAAGVGLILSVGAGVGRIDLSLLAVVGSSAFLYVPNTPIYHRMAVVMCCAFGLAVAFGVGLVAQAVATQTNITLIIPAAVAIVAAMSSVLVRYYDVGAPGYFFFVFAAILGAYMPFKIADALTLIGAVSVGGMVAAFMAVLYSLSVIYIFKNLAVTPVPARGEWGFRVVVTDSVIMGCVVGVGVAVGLLMGFERGYWVAVSTTAIMQGASLNAIWIKQTQRIIGTVIGVILAWWLISLNLGVVAFVLVMMVLMFISELVIMRNYALGVVFITPYITYLVEASSLMTYDASALVSARMMDVVIGSVLGLLGGFVIYKERLRMPFEMASEWIFGRYRNLMK